FGGSLSSRADQARGLGALGSCLAPRLCLFGRARGSLLPRWSGALARLLERGDDPGFDEQSTRCFARLGAVPEPADSLFLVHLEGVRIGQWVVVTEDGDDLAITRSRRVGDDDAVACLFLGPDAAQADSQTHDREV